MKKLIVISFFIVLFATSAFGASVKYSNLEIAMKQAEAVDVTLNFIDCILAMSVTNTAGIDSNYCECNDVCKAVLEATTYTPTLQGIKNLLNAKKAMIVIPITP